MSRRYPMYDECYMKVLLEEMFHVEGLLTGDKPDLITVQGDLGIEVAACIPKEQRKANSLEEKQYYTQLSDQELLWLYNYKKHQKPILPGKEIAPYVKLVKERIDIKINKKRNYKKTQRFGIAVYALYEGSDGDMAETYKHICKKNPELDFLFVDVTNQCLCLWTDGIIAYVKSYEDIQFEIAEKAYELYVQELNKFKK